MGKVHLASVGRVTTIVLRNYAITVMRRAERKHSELPGVVDLPPLSSSPSTTQVLSGAESARVLTIWAITNNTAITVLLYANNTDAIKYRGQFTRRFRKVNK